MLPEVVWMSQASAEVYEPGEREVCVSIRDPAAPLPDLSPRFIAVLSLEFEDDPEPGWEERGRSITEAQADQVIEFVERHVAARRIVVHCLVGVSRSPSLAAGLLVAHGRWAEPDRIVNPGGVSTHPVRLRSPARGAASLVSPPTAAAVTMESVEMMAQGLGRPPPRRGHRVAGCPREGPMEVLTAGLAVVVLYLFGSLRIIRQYERAVTFFLGRFWETKGPGLLFIPAIFAHAKRISLRIVALDITPQDVITRDNVSVKVNAVLYMRVIDPAKAVIEIQDYLYATSQLAQTTLRSVLGEVELDELLADREKINGILKGIIDERTDPWGIEVSAVEVKDLDLPTGMKRAMARQAEAERERRAKVIAAQGELQASQTLAQAARTLATEPSAIQLRYLQTVAEIAAENNSTTIFPIPIELFRPFIRAATGTATLAPSEIKAEGSPALPP